MSSLRGADAVTALKVTVLAVRDVATFAKHFLLYAWLALNGANIFLAANSVTGFVLYGDDGCGSFRISVILKLLEPLTSKLFNIDNETADALRKSIDVRYFAPLN